MAAGKQSDAQIKITADVKQAIDALRKLAGQSKIADDNLKKFSGAIKSAGKAVGTKRTGFANQVAGLAFIIKTTFLFSLASVGITAINKFKAALGNGVRAMIDFELQMAEINTLLNISSKRFNYLAKEIRGVFRNTPQDMEKVTRAAYNLVSAGVKVDDIFETLTLVSEAATAGLTENSVAAKAAISTMNAYRLEHEELIHVLDLEFQTVKKGILVYADVAENLGIILPAATRLGVSLEELHASFATLTKAGLSPAMAATALSRAFDQLMERAGKLKNIGVDVYDATGKFRGLANIINDIRILIGDLSDEERNRFYEIVNFEIRAGRAITGLVQQYDTLTDSIVAMFEAAGSKDEAYGKIVDTTSSRLKNAWNRLKDVRIEMEKMTGSLAIIVELWADISDFGGKQYKTIIEFLQKTVVMTEERLDKTKIYRREEAKIFIIEQALLVIKKEINKEREKENRGDKEHVKSLLKIKKQLMDRLKFIKGYEDLEKQIAENKKNIAEKEAVLDKEKALRILNIAELQEKFDKNRIKDLASIKLELMESGMTAAQIVELSENELRIKHDLLLVQEKIDKRIKDYYQTIIELKRIGIKNPIAGFDMSVEEGKFALEFLHKKLSEAESLISKWQQILFEQGKDINLILNMTYNDAKRLEEGLERYNAELRIFEKTAKEKMQNARHAIEFVFAYPMMNAFDRVIDGTEKVSKAFELMATGILKSLARILYSKLLEAFVSMLLGSPAAISIFDFNSLSAPKPVPGVLPGPGPLSMPGSPNFNLPTGGGNNIFITQNINVDRLLPHTEESLRDFTIIQQRLAIKEVRKML